MKYIGGAVAYVFKNFIFSFIFALLPSYFLSSSMDFKNLEVILDNVLSARADIDFRQIFVFLSPAVSGRWPFVLVCFVCSLVCAPMLLGFIEKHMRIGSRSLKGLGGRFNYNFLTVLTVMLIGVAVYEIWALIAAGLLFAEVLFLGGVARFIVVLITYLAPEIVRILATEEYYEGIYIMPPIAAGVFLMGCKKGGGGTRRLLWHPAVGGGVAALG